MGHPETSLANRFVRIRKFVQRAQHRVRLDETGQMTVFVALIFQVLFVFFAMVINIGLIVHDKINLQNAVDLGAYYGASRQAEILNEIAHVNYQMRQDYKLLTWRYRVLGTLGRGDAGQRGTVPPVRSAVPAFAPSAVVTEFPSVCVANPMWREFLAQANPDENYCYQAFGNAAAITQIRSLPVIAPFVPGVVSGAITIANLKQVQGESFRESGPRNWLFAAQIMAHYKVMVNSRKALMKQLRANLVAEDFKDQNAQSVSQGVLATIKKNLTVSNLQSFQDGEFKMINGLSLSPSCTGADGDGSKTITEIRTQPILLYTYPILTAGTFGVDIAALGDYAKIVPQDFGGFTQNRELLYLISEPDPSISLSSPEGLNASALGFEKNPWCMGYVGVHARSQPRKPFAPFGKPVVLEARAFAQPFGGRIGPWYMNRWNKGSDSSEGDRVDPRTSPRVGASTGENALGLSQLPNFSRYPGDGDGLSSKNAQAATRQQVLTYSNGQLSWQYYTAFNTVPTTGDALAWDTENADANVAGQRVLKLREAEILAVAPDLFDATYYTIDPLYALNYKPFTNRFGNLGQMLGLPIKSAPDVGGRNVSNGSDAFGVFEQIGLAQGALDPQLKNAGMLNWFLASADHLLTGWLAAGSQNFQFPTNAFAICDKKVSRSVPIPGGCAQGGRSGYSVRILAREHLLGNKWSVGGAGVAPAAINNPPPTDF